MMDPRNDADVSRLPSAYRDFYNECSQFIPSTRIYSDPVRTLAFGTDASVYRLTPKLVVKVRSVAEMSRILQIASRLLIPVTFRAAGTSLSGQAVTDSVLLVAEGGWKRYAVSADGGSIALEPGIIGAEANSYLKPYSRKIGPDPASINHALIGGIAANNASGMCCGTTDNSYKTVAGMKIIFHDGSQLDTGDIESRAAFASGHRPLLAAIERIRDEIAADAGLSELIAHKFRIKNTTGYGLNAFVDHTDAYEIIKHLMIGSEGTLGFISEITFRTIHDHPHKASALMIFPDMESTCKAVMKLDRNTVSAAELMDRLSLKSVEEMPGMPHYLKSLKESASALLVEIRGENHEILEQKTLSVTQLLADIPKEFPVAFTDVKEEYEALWNIRKGLFPAVGNVRRVGTSVIIEDIAFPLERLAEATLELRTMMIRHGYGDAIIFGHALDGNLHFVLTPDFTRDDEVSQYRDFMQEVCGMVVTKYGGSLKAEHGTGRNMAPFVEMEWGNTAYRLMREIKEIFDPDNLLNPGVIINDNPHVHLENLKPMPQAHEIIDKCIECGFCEVMCPSKNVTSTPRQRIIVQRQISRLKRSGDDPALLARLEEDYVYWGEKTCATDGLCATTCPVSINTGEFTKELRSMGNDPRSVAMAAFIARHFTGVTALVRSGLNMVNIVHRIIGTPGMSGLAGWARRVSGGLLPLWNPWMPKGGKTLRLSPDTIRTGQPRVVYFPSCVSRAMGPAHGDKDSRPLNQAILSLLDKAGYQVLLPDKLDQLCCGMAFDSKGFFEAAGEKSRELEAALLLCSNNGEYPVLCDTSPCLYRMRQDLDRRLTLFEPVEFIHDFLMERLILTKREETVAIHVTCSSTKMQLAEKFRAVAAACASRIIVPAKVACCGFAGNKGFDHPELTESALAELRPALPPECASGYSNSRPCEIGLSQHGGINYQSIVYLVDSCAEKGRHGKENEVMLESAGIS
jgi:D-lactate dehydrogenase